MYKHDYVSINKLKNIFPLTFEMHPNYVKLSYAETIYYTFDKNEDIIIDNINELRQRYLLNYGHMIFKPLETFMTACQEVYETDLDCPRDDDSYLKSSLPIDWDEIAYTGTSSVIGKKQEMNISSEEFYKSFPIDISKDEKIKYDIYSIPKDFEIEQYIPNSNCIKFEIKLH